MTSHFTTLLLPLFVLRGPRGGRGARIWQIFAPPMLDATPQGITNSNGKSRTKIGSQLCDWCRWQKKHSVLKKQFLLSDVLSTFPRTIFQLGAQPLITLKSSAIFSRYISQVGDDKDVNLMKFYVDDNQKAMRFTGKGWDTYLRWNEVRSWPSVCSHREPIQELWTAMFE